MPDFSSPKYIVLSLILIVAVSVSISNFSSGTKSLDNRSKAAGNSKTVCQNPGSGCDFTGAAGIQQAVDSSTDGGVIIINPGTYADATLMTPLSGGSKNTCFLNLKGKSLTLQGKGAVLFGEGHDKGTHTEGDPLYNRFGICTSGGTVTIDSLKIKEFEGGCMNLNGTLLTLKNSTVEGCDHGGLFLSGSSILAVNNYFIATMGLLPDPSSAIKAYNNIFWGKAINTNCNKTVPPIDFINNIVYDTELTIGAGWIYGDCPATAAEFKTKNIKYNIIWKDSYPCYANHEYCDDYTGKISADPMFNAPVVDPRGGAAWADWSLKEGSPAIGSGDPSIPGPRNLGTSGGPCADPNSTICTGFISANIPQKAIQPILAPGDNYYPPPGTNEHPEGPNQYYPSPDYVWPTSTEGSMTTGGANPPSAPPWDPLNKGGNNTGTNPQVTYYLPPTIGTSYPNQTGGNGYNNDLPVNEATGGYNNQNSDTSHFQPTIKPTNTPLINIKKSLDDTKQKINSFFLSVIKFTELIIP